jgi:hypothetical protein
LSKPAREDYAAAKQALDTLHRELMELNPSAARGRVGGNADGAGALKELWGPILAAMLIVVSGFSLFLFSSFPPTQRLGVLVCAGAALTDLVVLSLLSRQTQEPLRDSVVSKDTTTKRAHLCATEISPGQRGTYQRADAPLLGRVDRRLTRST